MEKKNKYEEMYEKLVVYERKIHESNQKKIRIGLKCIWIIPLIFLILLFWTDSNKVVFLILWIASLFAIAVYLILVEYSDYNLQEKLSEITDKEREPEALLGQEINEMGANIKNAIRKIDNTLNAESKEESKEASKKETESDKNTKAEETENA